MAEATDESGPWQVGETEPFICELLNSLTQIILDLQAHQIHMFYEAVGLMIAADGDAKRRDAYLVSCTAFARSHNACRRAGCPRGCSAFHCVHSAL